MIKLYLAKTWMWTLAFIVGGTLGWLIYFLYTTQPILLAIYIFLIIAIKATFWSLVVIGRHSDKDS